MSSNLFLFFASFYISRLYFSSSGDLNIERVFSGVGVYFDLGALLKANRFITSEELFKLSSVFNYSSHK